VCFGLEFVEKLLPTKLTSTCASGLLSRLGGQLCRGS
jgi:hypothetical protein